MSDVDEPKWKVLASYVREENKRKNKRITEITKKKKQSVGGNQGYVNFVFMCFKQN